MTFTYQVREGNSWSEPMTYAQAIAHQPERTETEWRHYEHLEATIGRAHAEVVA